MFFKTKPAMPTNPRAGGMAVTAAQITRSILIGYGKKSRILEPETPRPPRLEPEAFRLQLLGPEAPRFVGLDENVT